MHPALLAAVPSVSKQRGPVAQMQVLEPVPHKLVEVVSVLIFKVISKVFFQRPFQHPGGSIEFELGKALVLLKPKLTAAASHAALVPSLCLPVTDPHNSPSTYEYVIPLPQVEHSLLQ